MEPSEQWRRWRERGSYAWMRASQLEGARETVEEHPKEHAPAECGCSACQPERFARGGAESQPLHLCQRCFTGTCMTPVEVAAEPAPAE